MRFRVIDERGAYMNRSPEIVRLELGPDSAVSKAFNIRSPVYELLVEGTEVDLPGDFIPGPHLEPLDDEARAAMAKYLTFVPRQHRPHQHSAADRLQRCRARPAQPIAGRGAATASG